MWHNARTSLRKIRVQLLGEVDALVHDLPEDLRSQLPAKKTIRARVTSLARLDTSAVTDPTVLLRIQLIEHRVAMLHDVLEQDRIAARELAELVAETKSTRTDLVGIAPRAAAEIIVEVGDIRRFSEAGFRASTAPHRSRPAPPKATANPSDTDSAEAATGVSTRRSIASLSHNFATNHVPVRSTTGLAPTATPAAKRCASSSVTCPTPSFEPWRETPDNPPP